MDSITLFAQTNFRNQMKKFGIKVDDRRRHMYLIGKTGMGKSTIQENMIIDDIRAGKGVAVVDPHGDLAEKILEYIPANRINDVIYFNPADYEYPIAFNVVEQVKPEYRHIVASGLMGVFKKLWADSWGPRLEYILRNAILAVLDYPGSTLLAVTRMLSDKPFRKKIIAKIQDPVVKAFWVNEFAGYADKFASEAVSPIQNKVGQFLSTSLTRNIVGQVKSSIDMRQIMDEGKILIMNLSKGRIGEDNSSLLGAMMITKIQLAAMGRVNIPESERRDFYLYIDEFQNFSTESFANILSEARKYRLNLIMAHQYIEQLSEEVAAAVFGNIGTLVVFRIGANDAEELVKEFTPTFTEEDLVNLPKYEFYTKLMIDGIASNPFSAVGLPPLREDEKTDNADKVIKVTRERYARKREVVEEKIARWHELDTNDQPSKKEQIKPKNKPVIIPQTRKPLDSPSSSFQTNQKTQVNQVQAKTQTQTQTQPTSSASTPKVSVPAKALKSDSNKFQTKCSRCNKDTSTPFEPDGIRPVFCKDCLSELRKEKRDVLETRKKDKQAELNSQVVFENSQPDKEEEKSGGLSLSELSRVKPVDFKGELIKENFVENNSLKKDTIKQEEKKENTQKENKEIKAFVQEKKEEEENNNQSLVAKNEKQVFNERKEDSSVKNSEQVIGEGEEINF